MGTRTLMHRVPLCGLIVFVGMVSARTASAQIDVDSLPGDVKGEKVAFQRVVGVFIPGPSCDFITDVQLPPSDVTIETVTASLDVTVGVVPSVSLHTVVGGAAVDHEVNLTASPAGLSEHGPAGQRFGATHAVRIHHLARPNQPLQVLVSVFGGDCQVLGRVTVAGYYRLLPVRPLPVQ